MQHYDRLFARLAASEFRSRFRLNQPDWRYLHHKGLVRISRHASELVRRRLAPAVIPNDGKQTPYHGHPVFTAQHATACCCRGCLQKWHGIACGSALNTDEQSYIIEVLMHWLQRELENGINRHGNEHHDSAPHQFDLFSFDV
ncbi:DUF4186 domain-containing protein [Methylomonas rhizoryzae]|uniref:DUF4186 domain-containing protein n=1 Tax=Methylomonas rhizoryzae TaxID=2608981 RepID=UPI0012319D2E|nr:DUF4186 domain-containing protein [Methylomonas rhizoryzae]